MEVRLAVLLLRPEAAQILTPSLAGMLALGCGMTSGNGNRLVPVCPAAVLKHPDSRTAEEEDAIFQTHSESSGVFQCSRLRNFLGSKETGLCSPEPGAPASMLLRPCKHGLAGALGEWRSAHVPG